MQNVSSSAQALGGYSGSNGTPVPALGQAGGHWRVEQLCLCPQCPGITQTTPLWLLGARGSSQDHCWGLAAVVGKEGMGQREIKK